MKLLKATKIHIKAVLLCSMIFLVSFPTTSYSIPSKWERVEMSLSDLINSGWQITAHGTNRVATNSINGGNFDISIFSFLLTRNNNYIICIFENPKPPIANSTSCRKLN
jgi:hypothetical protein